MLHNEEKNEETSQKPDGYHAETTIERVKRAYRDNENHIVEITCAVGFLAVALLVVRAMPVVPADDFVEEVVELVSDG